MICETLIHSPSFLEHGRERTRSEYSNNYDSRRPEKEQDIESRTRNFSDLGSKGWQRDIITTTKTTEGEIYLQRVEQEVSDRIQLRNDLVAENKIQTI